MLHAISPIDGRYASKTKELAAYFSEYALIKYRVWVEIQYLIALHAAGLPELQAIDKEHFQELLKDWYAFSIEDAQTIKTIEKTTNHDVKAVEYFIKNQLEAKGLGQYKEFVHFGLTSQDINNTAIPYSIKQALNVVLLPALHQLLLDIEYLAQEWLTIPMLARTHGQPASPTTVGKELMVFHERLKIQLAQLKAVPHSAKFGGATGNMNAHYVAYPDYDWHGFAKHFVENYLGLERSYPTTQIEHYDNLAALFHVLSRISSILIDMCRDIWSYISMEFFKQKIKKGEVGSSAMPHKVNPIDFENAEGNLGLAIAIFTHLSVKLPVSRLQRDLTDSTVLRNVGTPFGHLLIALKSIQKGLSKLIINEAAISEELEENWIVLAEAIQSVLRAKGFEEPYEKLKQLTRNNVGITKEIIHHFIDELAINEATRNVLKQLSPHNYIGKY